MALRTAPTAQLSLLLMILLMSSLSGCLGDDDDGTTEVNPIDLIVYYESTNATIEEVYNNGQQTSRDGAEFSFDFRETRSSEGDIKVFTFDPGDGTDSVSIDAADESILTYTYQSHGIFIATLGAEDADNNTASSSLDLRVELHLSDTQSNTQNPASAVIDLTADDDSEENPAQLQLISTVENPDTFVFADSVSVTWSLKNSSGEEKATNNEQVGDDQSATWENQQSSPEPGSWSLDITIEVIGGDNEEVNVQSDLWVIYENKESNPNPEPPAA